MANEHLIPLWWPHPTLEAYWRDNLWNVEGATQPWVQALLYALCRALDVRRAVELGCWNGLTSCWLAMAISANGGGMLTVLDHNIGCLKTTAERLAKLDLANMELRQECMDSKDYVPPADTQFIFLDDDKTNVGQKVAAFAAACPGAYIAAHDIETVPDVAMLRLATPILHSSGHLGLVRV